jgi:hypothetical protein
VGARPVQQRLAPARRRQAPGQTGGPALELKKQDRLKRGRATSGGGKFCACMIGLMAVNS